MGHILQGSIFSFTKCFFSFGRSFLGENCIIDENIIISAKAACHGSLLRNSKNSHITLNFGGICDVTEK
jgi:hypothetical protein